MKVAVIGGGPSGLVTLKYLTTAHHFLPIDPIEARLFESEAQIGGTFRHRTYEDAELVSSTRFTTFSDFRCSAEAPDFLSAEQYCTYLEAYAAYFELWKHIHTSARVISVLRHKDGHVVKYLQPGDLVDEWLCNAIAICSGLHVLPNIPHIDGIEHIPMVLHSSEYKLKTQFGIDKNVIILGTGETGMDISLFAIKSPTRSVVLSHRDGFMCLPKRVTKPVTYNRWDLYDPTFKNVPTDTSLVSLFDTAYVHPLLRRSSLLWDYYDQWVKKIFFCISGTQQGLDQWIGGLPDEKRHISRVIPVKSTDTMPYISAPYRSTERWNRLRSLRIQVPIPDTSDRVIDLAPWPDFIDKDGIVHFLENGRPEAETMRKKVCKPDILIFATGYVQKFPFLDESYPTPDQANIRQIWKQGDSSVGFIGFVRPGVGAIPPLAEMQAQLWVLSLHRLLPRPLSSAHQEEEYQIGHQSGRITYSVDHESYAYRLALDMASAPSIFQVMARGWKVAFTWAFGPNFNTKFRMVGPWKLEGSEDIMRGELYRTVRKRGGLVYDITYSAIPFFIFGLISLTLWVTCLPVYISRLIIDHARKRARMLSRSLLST